MSVVIKAENLSKAYQLGEFSTGTISNDIERWWALMRGKDDPFLKVGETNDRSIKGTSNVVWSLKDINFDIKQGDSVGIIGRNGAGKSTLLKILSRVTTPTTGNIKIKGRIASLLEVGTGFHPELTGRENIFLNGAILGMRKHEIVSKFDEIVDFSGVERYIDTPVKRYSSGMYVRLAFAVAAHLESEILIVDEVLAVGDAEFQKKCLGKMGDVSKSDGRTILFVSHNMAAIKQLCSKSLLLVNGNLVFSGLTEDTIPKYLQTSKNEGLKGTYTKLILSNNDLELVEGILLDDEMKHKVDFSITENINIQIKIVCRKKVPGLKGYVAIRNNFDDIYIESDTFDFHPNILDDIDLGENIYNLQIDKNILPIGEYYFYINFTSDYDNSINIDTPKDILTFTINDNETIRGNNRKALTSKLIKWERNYVNR